MAQKIAIYNLKGGVGKTTTTSSLAGALSKLNKKVLVMDMDPQSSLTFLVADRNKVLSGTMEEIYFGRKTIDESIEKGSSFDYIGSTLRLSKGEMELSGKYNREQIIKKAIAKSSIEKDYDYVLFDCPPGMGIFALNAIASADSLLIPCQCELLAMEGMGILFELLEEPIENLNPTIEILGILPTRLDGRKALTNDAYEMLKMKYDNVFEPIRENVRLSELGIDTKNIFESDSKSNGAKDYMKLAEVILGGKRKNK
ncbi:MAG: ParA family protein [Fusobacteriaceae bacterium]|nr:ParA family protein [Fusobacteriaceae bacterium]